MFAAMDAVMKGLSLAIGAYSAMVWRCAAGCVIAGLPWLATRPSVPAAGAMRLHLLRGAVTALMTVSFFWGLARVPMAQAIALTFVAPLLALYLAAVLLGEKVGRGAIHGSLVAFAGVLVILAGATRGEGDPSRLPGIAAIIFSALCYAYNLVLQRQQAQAAGPLEIAFFQSATIGLFLVLAAPVVPIASPAGHWWEIALAALLASVSLLLLSWGYARAPASYLVPVEYSAFIWACLFGWAVFGEAVGLATLAGAALIVCGCVVAMRSRPVAVAGPGNVEIGL
nr:DMT family transporter [Sphingomonas quercus]